MTVSPALQFSAVKRMLHKPHTNSIQPERPTSLAFALTQWDLPQLSSLTHPQRRDSVFLRVNPENKDDASKNTLTIVGSNGAQRSPLKTDRQALNQLIDHANVSKSVKRRMRKALAYQLNRHTNLKQATLDTKMGYRYVHALELLTQNLIGQDRTLIELTGELAVKHWYRQDASKPAVFALLEGPAESGKTFALNTLAQATGQTLYQLNCSELSSPQDIRQIIGSAPGYTGYGCPTLLDTIGELAADARKKDLPNPIVALDELPKLHPNIATMLVKALDTGFLVKGDGTQVDISNIDFFATATPQEYGAIPENLRKRINVHSQFTHLSETPDGMIAYVNRVIHQVQQSVQRRLGITLEVDGPTTALLHCASYGNRLRHIQDLVRNWLTVPLTDSLMDQDPSAAMPTVARITAVPKVTLG